MQSVDFFDERDDADLLARARSGDTQCADVLWIRTRPAVLAAARGIAKNRHDAEDLASEAMAKVFAAIADGQGPADSILPYLYTTVRNLHISSLRRQARVGLPVELHEERVLNLVTTEPDVIESELVTSAFTNLPTRWRYVLWASLVEGRPGSEIAGQLGIKPAAVHALKSRALEGLRQQYLSEHAKLSEEQECAGVHQVLASIARGRTRRSTDLNQVWRHLRNCEHCAEGYREITAINSRIGALLGPAAAALVGFVPHTSGAAVAEALRVPAAAGKLVAAASAAGVIAIAGTVFTLESRHEPARVTTTESHQNGTPVPQSADNRPRNGDGAATAPGTPTGTEEERACRALGMVSAPSLGLMGPGTALKIDPALANTTAVAAALVSRDRCGLLSVPALTTATAPGPAAVPDVPISTSDKAPAIPMTVPPLPSTPALTPLQGRVTLPAPRSPAESLPVPDVPRTALVQP